MDPLATWWNLTIISYRDKHISDYR